MMIKDITDFLETFFPLTLAYEWDHCGLQVGNIHGKVENIMIALTPDIDVMQECIDHHIDLLITHHPLLFHPLYYVNTEEETGKIIEMALNHHITIYSSHTCMDRGSYLSMNKWLMEAMQIEDYQDYGEDGLIKTAALQTTLGQLIKQVKKDLNLPALRYVGNCDQPVNNIAVIGGSGADFIDELAGQVDVLITGDIKYHEAQNAYSKGLCLIDIGHFAERVMVPQVKKILQEKFDVAVYESQQKDYFQFG
ncbi:Nif3-like dinuclear metal center hexameric protein [Beduini massiliensis]|uniref:Nif3-like dinuclear metal center hexameric protein n=1 Tax=Beduini massiliensis TaxID=1585974 RepID=UPI00059A7D56|nr:Nif3-like dinuclear metal center hexameric protein [Beduini massiliensis]